MIIVNKRSLNEGETFCCNIHDAKMIFNENYFIDIDFRLNFGHVSREFQPWPNIYSFVRKNVKGNVIAYMVLDTKKRSGGINFYVIKSKDFNDEKRKQFKKTILPKLREICISKFNSIISEESTLKYHIIIDYYNDDINIFIKTNNR